MSRANPQNTVPHRYTAVRPSAPPASLGTTSDPYREPPSYQQLLASDPRVREQRTITRLENRGYSNTARVLAGIFNTTTQQPSNHDLPRLQTPSTRTSTETNTRRDLIADPAQRSWRAYFNSADRLRELTIYSRTRDTFNETDIPTTPYQPRSQTPPPMYHEVEQTAVRITRSESLPSYDDFIASPHKYMT